MLRCVSVATVLGLVLLLEHAPTAPQGKKGPAPLQIRWHGQSFFEITSTKGTSLLIDPHNIDAYRLFRLTFKPDIVLMSHHHDDHTRLEVIDDFKKLLEDKKMRVIRGLKGTLKFPEWDSIDEAVKDFRIRSVGTYHDDTQGLKYGKNAVFCLEVDGWKIVHLGDLGHMLTPEQIKKIGPVDVLMIPVGGIYTLNGEQARRVVDQLKPKEFVIPMHCGTKVYDDLLSPREFLDEFHKDNVVVAKDNMLPLFEARRKETRPRPTVTFLNYEAEDKK